MILFTKKLKRLAGLFVVLFVGINSASSMADPFWNYPDLSNVKTDIVNAYQRYVKFHFQLKTTNSSTLNRAADCASSLVLRRETLAEQFRPVGSLFSSIDDSRQLSVQQIKEKCNVKNAYVLINSPMTDSPENQVNSLALVEKGHYIKYLSSKKQFGINVSLVKDADDKVSGVITTFLW